LASLLYTELLKLKRSKMFFISILGSSVAPILIVVASFLHMKTKTNVDPVLFEELFFQGNLYTVVILGVPLYGVVTAYLFIREYLEDTLKNLLTIPVSRNSLIMSKSILLFMWIMFLSIFTWCLTLGLGVLFQFEGLSVSLILQSFGQFIWGGVLLFVLSSPIIFITLWFKNYVPTIISTIVITLMNVMASNSEHRDLFPWAAAGDIATDTMLSTYPAMYSFILIGITSIVGWVLTIVYFNRVDVN